MGFYGVHWEHGHVFDHAGDGAGDHELPEVEAVVGRNGGVLPVVLGLRNRAKIWVFEFGRGIGGHGRSKIGAWRDGFGGSRILEMGLGPIRLI